MKRRIFIPLAFCLAASLLLAGCGKKEEAPPEQAGPAPTNTAKTGSTPAGRGPQLGVNPNYSGPANGGYDTKTRR